LHAFDSIRAVFWVPLVTPCRPLFLLAGALTVALSFAARADDAEAPPPPTDAAPIESQPPPPPAQQTRWEGAIGLNTSYAPAYQGATQTRIKLTPGFFLRYGRFTVTNSSGYVTRREDDVFRGLGVDLRNTSRLRINLAGRYDAGRSESSATALNGLGDVKPTLRLRLSATYRLDDGWRAGAGWSVDVLGRGGGNFGDVSFGREMRWSPDTVWSWGASLSAANDRYMQTYFGIDEEQAARTGYPVYRPGTGLRDVGLFANLRTELNADWVLLAGIGATRLIGPAAASPLTTHPFGWGLSAGLAWRF